jgi:hypothetical protein
MPYPVGDRACCSRLENMGYPDMLHPSLIARVNEFAESSLQADEHLRVSCATKLGWLRERWLYAFSPRSIYISVTDKRVLFFDPTWWGGKPARYIGSAAVGDVQVVDSANGVIMASDVGRLVGRRFFTLSDTFSDEASEVLRSLPNTRSLRYEEVHKNQRRINALMAVALIMTAFLAGAGSVLIRPEWLGGVVGFFLGGTAGLILYRLGRRRL